MQVKFIQDEDFTNYHKCSLFIGTTKCSFKCEHECGIQCCQNSELVKSPTIEISDDKIIQKYLNNPFTSAIVIGGMEPLDTYEELLNFITKFRKLSLDDLVIYTGYYENEVADKIVELKKYPNITIKFGRFIPNAKHKFDEVLGVELASDNQYAEKIS